MHDYAQVTEVEEAFVRVGADVNIGLYAEFQNGASGVLDGT
jgi:hypothetical protein